MERRRLESQALGIMKNAILGNTESLRPTGEEEEEHNEHPVAWLQVVGRPTVQLGMDVYDLLDILQRTAPRRLRGAPEEAELAYEHPTSPWKELGGVFERPRSSSRHHQQVDPYEGQSLGDDARKGVGRAVSILRSLVRRSGWNGAFCEPVLNSIDSDIGRSGFADIGMSGSLRVFWRSHPEACSGTTPG